VNLEWLKSWDWTTDKRSQQARPVNLSYARNRDFDVFETSGEFLSGHEDQAFIGQCKDPLVGHGEAQASGAIAQQDFLFLCEYRIVYAVELTIHGIKRVPGSS
jgi:hypothetical protein